MTKKRPEEQPAVKKRRADAKWNGLPVYRCRFCQYERVDKPDEVTEHESGHQAGSVEREKE